MASQESCLHPVQEWIRAAEDAGSGFNRMLLAICAHREAWRAEAARMCVRTLQTFGTVCGMDREVLVIRAAGRINVLGTHIDHRGGSVNPVAVNHMWLVVAPRDDDVVTATNVEPGVFAPERFRISECLPQGKKIDDWDSWCYAEFEKRKGDPSITWSNYIRAAVLYLQNIYTQADGSRTPRFRGMDMVFYGNIPRAVGLSSSSSLVVATAEAVVRINALEIDRSVLVTHCGYAEWYVGTRGGNCDHAAILFAQPNAIVHITTFPCRVESILIPEGYSLVLANSLIEAKKQAGARSAFNSRIAAYIFGFLLIQKQFPEYAEKLEHLRDINPERLGVSEGRIYQILKSLPESAGRREVLELLPDRGQKLLRVFRSHDEPEGGYPIRKTCLYGVAECIRSDMVPECLRREDMRRFGELMNASHDGDRVVKHAEGRQIPTDSNYPDARLHALFQAIESGDPAAVEQARLWRQPGGYSVSIPEVDALTDIALATPGVVGAGLVGAGMGGCIVAAVESGQARRLIENMAEQYYGPRSLPVAAEEVTPVGGLHTFSF